MSKRKNDARPVRDFGMRAPLLIATAFVAVALLTIGVFAKNGWFPSTDSLTGAKTGWFGAPLSRNAATIWNPLAAPLPNPTPQLSKEYIYAGSRLLAVEDANANAVPPADLAVWRPSTGTWWVMGGQGSLQVTQSWGTNGDDPVEGDYDGDGKTDFSVFRPLTNTWYVVYSSTNTTGQFAFGTSGDIPAQADFDGDGRTDAAVFRSPGVWYILQSSNSQMVSAVYGNSTDTPSPADFDGDGRADLAVWRASNQTFYSLNSSNSVAVTAPHGGQSGLPVSADYDGDGRAAYALSNSANATWYIRLSSTGLMSIEVIPWVLANDIPVQNDYDGDGKCDVAVWRPAESSSGAGDAGTWYIRQSASGNSLRQVQWGIPGDIPVPALYRRR